MRHRLLMLCLLLATGALAAEAPTHSGKATLSEVVDAQKRLRADIEAGRQTFAPDSKKRLLEAQDSLFAIAANNSTEADLNEQEWVDLFNAQEEINQIVQKSAADSREVCRRERPTGSNRSRTTCRTVAEWRANEPSQLDLLRISREAGEGAMGPGR
jgi:predicted transglutaminase-like cysteine proteinase